MKEKMNDVSDNNSAMIDNTDTSQYFTMGNVRIKISEHFASTGKTLGSLLEDVIQHAALAS